MTEPHLTTENPATGGYTAISDDRSQLDPALTYGPTIDLGDSILDSEGITLGTDSNLLFCSKGSTTRHRNVRCPRLGVLGGPR